MIVRSNCLALGGDKEGWEIQLRPDGSIKNLRLKYNNRFEKYPFCDDACSGPKWDGVKMAPVDNPHIQFEGKKDGIHYSLQYKIINGTLVVMAGMKNEGTQIFKPDAARFTFGLDTAMIKYPDWEKTFYPTLLRCERTHFWGYFMTPEGCILAMSSPDPIASWSYIFETSYGHRIKTVSLDMLHKLPLPPRHPQDRVELKPGEERFWSLFLMAVDRLDMVKSVVSENIGVPMFDIKRYTVGEDEPFEGNVLSHNLARLVLISPDGEKRTIPTEHKGNGIHSFAFKSNNPKGVFSLIATSHNGKISEAMVTVRHSWSWYLKAARENAIGKPQKASVTVESWYGFFSLFLAQKYFPNEKLWALTVEKYNEIFPLLFNGNGDIMTIYGSKRPQNQAATASMLVDLYEATGDIKALERAAALADFLMTQQKEDGGYYDPREGRLYTTVLNIPKSVLEVALAEKRLMKKSRIWKERYERHVQSAKAAIDDLVSRGNNLQTEGEMTFDADPTTIFGFYALHFAAPNKIQTYIDAAVKSANENNCQQQIIVPDSRMNGGGLRFWEAQYDVMIKQNMMSSPHGWTACRIYGLWYLYLLTGDEDWLRQAQNALGSCVQLVDSGTGELYWAFICDPYVDTDVFKENPDSSGGGIHVKTIIGEQYIPMISGWYRAPKGQVVHYKGHDDNDVHEIFKCLEEVALTSAYVIEREDGNISTYNCKASRNGSTLIIAPFEAVVSSVHLNLRKKHQVVIVFAEGEAATGMFHGMKWVHRGANAGEKY